MLTTLLASEPVFATLIGNAALWPALFELSSVFGHPFTDPQQHAIVTVGLLLSGFLIRARVAPITKPPDAGAVDLSKVGKP